MSALFNIPLLLLAAGSSIRVIDDANDEKPNYYKVSFDVAPSGSRVIKEEMEALHQGERDVAMGVALQPSPTPVLKEEMEALHASLLSLGLTETASRLVKEAQAAELDRLHQSLLSLGLVETAQTLLKESQVPVQEGSQPHAGALLNTTHERVKDEPFRTLVYVENGFHTGQSAWSMGSAAGRPDYDPVGQLGWEFALLFNQFEGLRNGEILLVGARAARVQRDNGATFMKLHGLDGSPIPPGNPDQILPWKVIEDGYLTWSTGQLMDLKFYTIQAPGHAKSSGALDMNHDGIRVPIDGVNDENIPALMQYPVFAGDPTADQYFAEDGVVKDFSWDRFNLVPAGKTPGNWAFDKDTKDLKGKDTDVGWVNAIMNHVWGETIGGL